MKTAQTRPYYLLVLLAAVGLLSLAILRPYVITLVLAVVFAVALYPLYVLILRNVRSVPLAALITLLAGSICVLVPLVYIGLNVFAEGQHVYASLISGADASSIQTLSAKVGAWLGGFIPGANAYVTSLAANVSVYVKLALAWVFQNIGGIFSTVAGMLVQLFIFLMALYYLFANGDYLRENMLEWSPLSEGDTAALMRRMTVAITSLVRSRALTLVIEGVVAGVGFFIFGVPDAFLWGVVAAFAALIPNVGIWLVFVPAVLYIAAIGHIGAAIGLGIWAIVAVVVIDNIVSPWLSGKGTQLNPLLTLLSIFGGLAFFGLSGLLLGPIILSLFFAVLSTYAASVEKAA